MAGLSGSQDLLLRCKVPITVLSFKRNDRGRPLAVANSSEGTFSTFVGGITIIYGNTILRSSPCTICPALRLSLRQDPDSLN